MYREIYVKLPTLRYLLCLSPFSKFAKEFFVLIIRIIINIPDLDERKFVKRLKYRRQLIFLKVKNRSKWRSKTINIFNLCKYTFLNYLFRIIK